MASIDALYHSDSQPQNQPPDIGCPIKDGDHFGGLVTVTFPAPGFAAYIEVAFCIVCQGYREWAFGVASVAALATQKVIAVSSDLAHAYWPSLPATFDSHGLTPGGYPMGTNKRAIWAGAVDWEWTAIMPGSTNWDTPLPGMGIASDNDANVYGIPALPTPDISWIQIVSAVAYKR